ncbi:MAG: hypothetical protein WBX81_05590 [Nitrososphaeraceae archaeon]
MKNIPNVLALPLLNLDLVSVIVTLHRHDSMLDTNKMIMIARFEDEQNEPFSQSTYDYCEDEQG